MLLLFSPLNKPFHHDYLELALIIRVFLLLSASNLRKHGDSKAAPYLVNVSYLNVRYRYLEITTQIFSHGLLRLLFSNESWFNSSNPPTENCNSTLRLASIKNRALILVFIWHPLNRWKRESKLQKLLPLNLLSGFCCGLLHFKTQRKNDMHWMVLDAGTGIQHSRHSWALCTNSY